MLDAVCAGSVSRRTQNITSDGLDAPQSTEGTSDGLDAPQSTEGTKARGRAHNQKKTSDETVKFIC